MVIIISLSQVSSSCLVKQLLRLFVIFFQETEITTSEHVIVSFITTFITYMTLKRVPRHIVNLPPQQQQQHQNMH